MIIGTYHRYVIEKIKSKNCKPGLDTMKYGSLKKQLGHYNIPYGVCTQFIAECKNLGLLEIINKRNIVILPECPHCERHSIKIKEKKGRIQYKCRLCGKKIEL